MLLMIMRMKVGVVVDENYVTWCLLVAYDGDDDIK